MLYVSSGRIAHAWKDGKEPTADSSKHEANNHQLITDSSTRWISIWNGIHTTDAAELRLTCPPFDR